MSLLTPAGLTALRNGDRADLLLAIAFVLGIGLSTVHWTGLIAGGVVVGLTARSLRRAFVLGLYLGGTVLLLFVVSLLLAGTVGRWAGLGQLTALSIATSLVLPPLGASIRGVI